MTTILNFKSIVDIPKWRPIAPSPSTHLSGNPYPCDLRNNEDRHPYIFYLFGTSFLLGYDVKKDGWISFTNIALVTQCQGGVFMPAQGPRGTIAAGATTTSIPLTTALPASVGANQLADRGDGIGFKIRIIGKAAGSSGKTEERYVIANTSGTTPTIILDSPLSFAPIAGDVYEFLSGKLYAVGNSNSAGNWRSFDTLTGAVTSLSTTNLPASISDTSIVGLDELYVPYNRSPGEGFFNILTATATAGTTLTGQAVGGDAGVLLNEYRNFQIRIVEDIAIPTAVGQRRNITSHTAGASPVYTVPVWTVTPSATAIYVIENNGDRILLWVSLNINTFTYQIGTNAWDSSATFSARPTTAGAGVTSAQSFSIELDPSNNARHSFIYSFRGGLVATLDLLDIAGGGTGLWTGNIVYNNNNNIFGTGTSGIIDPATNQGRYLYINQGNTSRFFRFDMKNRELEPFTLLKFSMPGGAIGQKVAYTVFVDGVTKLSFVIVWRGSDVLAFRLPIIR